jgi:hypothetical protein
MPEGGVDHFSSTPTFLNSHAQEVFHPLPRKDGQPPYSPQCRWGRVLTLFSANVLHPISWGNVSLETHLVEGGARRMTNTSSSVRGMKSFAQRKPQQTTLNMIFGVWIY